MSFQQPCMRYGSFVHTCLVVIVAMLGGERTASAQACEEVAKLTASDAAAVAGFGASVSISGDTAIVGAFHINRGNGSAYVFARRRGDWTQQQKLTASEEAPYDYFGLSVSISGDTAIVGAPGPDSASGSAAYVFTRTGDVWTLQQKLTASNGGFFGSGVAISGDTAIVGAPGDGGGVGAAYVFTRSGGVWTLHQKLTASDAAIESQFGQSISISGETAIVGASDTTAGANAGSAYVFTRTSGVWTEQQKLTASDAAAGDLFGYSVSISGDTAIVGAWFDDTAAGANAGSAYIFSRTGDVWTEQQQLTAPDGYANDNFGHSVWISGETAIVGAHRYDTAAGGNAGSAFVFTRTSGVWIQQQQLTASDAAGFDLFGYSVSISGDTAIVGAHGDGSAYIFGCAHTCLADISPQPNGDGSVNIADLLLVIANWGQGAGNPADVNGDNIVNIADLLAVISAWGPCP